MARIVTPRVAGNEGALVQVLSSRPHGRWLVRSLDGPRPCEDGTLRLEAVASDSELRPVSRGRAGTRRPMVRRAVKPAGPVQLALLG